MDGSQATKTRAAALFVFERTEFPRLLEALKSRGYSLIGPTVREGAIVYDKITGVGDLPEGWTDRQAPGSSRLEKRNDAALFGHNVGPHSWKQYLFPPRVRLWQADRDGAGFRVEPEPLPPERFAFIGARACDLAAIAVQDRIFAGADSLYTARRESLFIVAVGCGQAGGTCFCTSMGTGPRVTGGFDLSLVEVVEEGCHFFVVEVGSEAGALVLRDVPHRPATPAEAGEPDRAAERATREMGRSLETEGIKDLLYRNYEHPRWDDVASRCLSCANCTLVCPTCFCNTVEDVTDLTGDHAERWRSWDSCFTMAFSFVAGGSARPSTRARYRQWMVHKLAAWQDQYGTSGCVGCGRCITWCPAGIDITAEAAAIREHDGGGGSPEPPVAPEGGS